MAINYCYSVFNQYKYEIKHSSINDVDQFNKANWGLLYVRCKYMYVNIVECVSPYISDYTLNTVGPFYLVHIPG